MDLDNIDSEYEKLKNSVPIFGDIKKDRYHWCTDYDVLCYLNQKGCNGPKQKSCPAHKKGMKTTTELELEEMNRSKLVRILKEV